MQGMARKFYGIPYFEEIRKVAGKFLRPSGASDQYLQCTASIKFAAGKAWNTTRGRHVKRVNLLCRHIGMARHEDMENRKAIEGNRMSGTTVTDDQDMSQPSTTTAATMMIEKSAGREVRQYDYNTAATICLWEVTPNRI